MKKEFISGKEISDIVVEKLRSNFSTFQKNKKEIQVEEKNKKDIEKDNKVSLAVFVVGDDPVIESFVKIKQKIAERIGVRFDIFKYNDISEEEFTKYFEQEQKKFDGVIVQLPLPENFNTEKILSKIDRKKDVDFLNPQNIFDNKNGKISEIFPLGKAIFAPVSLAIFKIMSSVDYDFYNKKIVIVGKGKLVGEPFSDDLKNLNLKENKDFYFINRKTTENQKKELLKTADLIVSGVGVPNFIKKDDIKDGVFLIDAGTSTANKKLIGDISLDCLEKSSFFSKTPGGVGPVTVVSLYENL
jgi:methylenetetrahydrofolate dehydrogenase (NADP+)/methenyltetrahydrofolate cyclohydrolase